ncbi:redoxin domain-containing protein [bacterium]|nr:redoxin domain-containing protein [bacterium]
MKIAKYLCLLLFAASAYAITGVGEEAPDFTLTSSDQNLVTLSSFEGDIVVLAFLNINNESCTRLAQALETDVWQSYHDDGVEVIVVLKAVTPNTALIWKHATGVTYTVLADPSESVWDNYRVTGDNVPLSMVIDKNMIIRCKDNSSFTSTTVSEIEALFHAGVRQTTWWRIKQLFNKSN